VVISRSWSSLDVMVNNPCWTWAATGASSAGQRWSTDRLFACCRRKCAHPSRMIHKR